MPTASKMKKKLRRAKREATRALQMLEFALKQRDQARYVAGALDAELKILEAKQTPQLTITKIEDTDEKPSNDDSAS